MSPSDAPPRSVTAAPSGGRLDRHFAITARGSTTRRELLGGLSTFLTMSYILFVNPAILSAAGVPFAAVAVATALAAALATLAMGLIANLPFGLASGLGLNAVVAFDLILGRHLPWPTAMACVVIMGLISALLVLAGLRQAILRAMPVSMRLAIAVGIGLFIALIGLRNGAIVINDPATGIGVGDLTGGPALISLAGLGVALALTSRGARGAILAGIATTTALGLIFGVLEPPEGVLAVPHSGDFTTIGKALSGDALSGALTVTLIPVIFSLFMAGFFDTIGTSTGLATQAGLLDERQEIPAMGRMLLIDSGADAVGGAMGVSAVTTYIESSAGIAEGARTGLASVVTGSLFALAVFAAPVIALVGQQVPIAKATFVSPAICPALVMAGYLMTRLIAQIDWSEHESAIPAFLVIAGIPMTFSIADGIGLGVLGYAIVMVVGGKASRVHPLMWLLVAMFLTFFASDWLQANVF
jgi:adenine/guanine/hypoxanthine permease